MRERSFLQLKEVIHLGTNRVHQARTLTTTERRQDASLVMLATQFDDTRHLHQFGVYQGRERIQVFLASSDRARLKQIFQLAPNAVVHRPIRLQKDLVTGYQVATLTGIGIFQCRQQGIRPAQRNEGVFALLG